MLSKRHLLCDRFPRSGGLAMSEQISTREPESSSKRGGIAATVLAWSILGLLIFTCIMAAIRKFGG
jgi:hypothetical protein